MSSDQPPEIASVWHACGAIFYRMLVNSGSTQKRQSVHKTMYAYLLIGHVWRFYLCLRSEPAHDSRAKRKGIVTFYFFSRSFKDWRRYSGTLSLELASWPSLFFLNPPVLGLITTTQSGRNLVVIKIIFSLVYYPVERKKERQRGHTRTSWVLTPLLLE